MHGDQEGWRNETLTSEHTGWKPQDFNVEEKHATTGGLSNGLLEFDYVSLRPLHRAVNTHPMSTVIYRLFLHEFAQVAASVQVQHENKHTHKHAHKHKQHSNREKSRSHSPTSNSRGGSKPGTPAEPEDERDHAAIAKIQAMQRGKMARRKISRASDGQHSTSRKHTEDTVHGDENCIVHVL